MVQTELTAALLSVGVFAGTLALLAVVFRAQTRRYDRTVTTELLDDWTARLQLLEPQERAGVAPPSEVVAAMVALPSPGLRSSWSQGPTRSR